MVNTQNLKSNARIASLTAEQQEILQHDAQRLLISAYAGTGKTSTLVEFANRNPGKPILYLAYNRAIRDAATAQFPSHVVCKTAHQLAYLQYGQFYKHQLTPQLRLMDIAKASEHEDWALIKRLQMTLTAFLWSDASKVQASHVPSIGSAPPSPWLQHRIVEAAQRLWEKMCDRSDPFPMTHDGYLKQYQLGQPNLATRYAALLFDEAQDANPVLSQIILNQPTKLLFVGDPHQQIYRWRGAVNSFENPEILSTGKKLYLSYSFRFGGEIATAANAILKLKSEAKPLVGAGSFPGQLIRGSLKKTPKAILHRTVMGVMHTALSSHKQYHPIYWIGGIEAYQLSFLKDLYHFSLNQFPSIRNKSMIKDYGTYQKYCRIASESKDHEMNRAIALIEKYRELPKRLHDLGNQSTDKLDEARLILSTVHKSKGLEWEYVELADDFIDPFEANHDTQSQIDELNLLYVAVTRASRSLGINGLVASLMKKAELANPSNITLEQP